MRRGLLGLLVILCALGGAASACAVRAVFIAPGDDRAVEAAVVPLIRAAQRTVDLAMPSFPYGPIGEAVVNAHERGVAVRVIVDASAGESAPAAHLWLVTAGISVRYEPTLALLEHRFAVIDGARIVVGSYDWPARTPQSRYGQVLIIDCSATPGAGTVASQFVGMFDRLWALLAPAPGAVSAPAPLPPSPLSRVVLHQVDPAGECIWLLNISDAPVDISGWSLSDLEGSYVFPAGTVLEPDDPFAVCMATYNPTEDPSGLYLNDEHDEVYLVTPDGRIADEHVW